MKKPVRPKPAFGVEREDVPGVLERADVMHMAFVASLALFPALPVTMAAFLLLLQAAQAAQSATLTRTVALAAVRDVKVDALWTAMKSLKTYVEGLAGTMSAVDATALITSAGLLVAQTPNHDKPLFSSRYVAATGIVHLAVNASVLIGYRTRRKTTFTWSWTMDGGKTWSSVVTTGYASAEIPGLGPGTYRFRVFVTVGKTPGEPVDGAALTIH